MPLENESSYKGGETFSPFTPNQAKLAFLLKKEKVYKMMSMKVLIKKLAFKKGLFLQRGEWIKLAFEAPSRTFQYSVIRR